MKELKEYISILSTDVGGLKTAAQEEIKGIEELTPPVKIRVNAGLRSFITEQQEEYFKFHKEICVLAKEKGEIEKEITKSVERVEQLEEAMGIPHTELLPAEVNAPRAASASASPHGGLNANLAAAGAATNPARAAQVL